MWVPGVYIYYITVYASDVDFVFHCHEIKIFTEYTCLSEIELYVQTDAYELICIVEKGERKKML